MSSTRSHARLGMRFLLWFAIVTSLGLAALFAVVQWTPQPVAQARGGDEMLRFVRRVLGSTEDVWDRLFASAGATYEKPKLVIFSGALPTACGTGLAASGPFYCPLDRKLYLDFEFFDQLARRYEARGDFAQIYVIAHEVAHHVQTLLGIEERVHAFELRSLGVAANQVLVRFELQADCLAGVWASMVQERLELGDLEEAFAATKALGDDTIDQKTTGVVVPDSFTHGTAEQRTNWFKRGLAAGQIQACNTFDTPDIMGTLDPAAAAKINRLLSRAVPAIQKGTN